MTILRTRPGIPVEDPPDNMHSITGAATSVAAFVGWVAQGPTRQAPLIRSWSDYQRLFGGLDSRSLLGYSVNQFFLNGGQQACIVRLLDAATAKAASVTIGSGNRSLVVSAINPGAWANEYQIRIANSTTLPGRFELDVLFAPNGAMPTAVESFRNLGIVTPDPQGSYVVDVLANDSDYVMAAVPSGTTGPPGDTTLPAGLGSTIHGDDGTVLAPSNSTTISGAFEAALQIGGGTGGINLLRGVDLFNLLCVPGEIVTSVLSALDAFCAGSRAFLIADSDPSIADPAMLSSGPGFSGNNSAFYFPWLQAQDPLAGNAIRNYPPCGFVAGIYADTDGTRGVWKAPAGTETTISGVSGVAVLVNDMQNALLEPHAVNCIRTFAGVGTMVEGARTTGGTGQTSSQWRYVPVRRLALFLETSLLQGTQWVVFEPNDALLWDRIRLNIGAFLQTLFVQGAFQGTTPEQAYFVKCDGQTTTPADQANGIVNITVGFAPLQPAEFVILQIQQKTQ